MMVRRYLVRIAAISGAVAGFVGCGSGGNTYVAAGGSAGQTAGGALGAGGASGGTVDQGGTSNAGGSDMTAGGDGGSGGTPNGGNAGSGGTTIGGGGSSGGVANGADGGTSSGAAGMSGSAGGSGSGGSSGWMPCENPRQPYAQTPTGGTSGNFQTTDAVCYIVTSEFSLWVCGVLGSRTVTVNGVPVTCNMEMGTWPLPERVDGAYYFEFTAGNELTWFSWQL